MRSQTAKHFRLYLVTNTVNGKQYVGITVAKLARRWYLHCRAAVKPTTLLQRAIAKYGASAFTVEQIASAQNWNDLQAIERQAIAQYGTFSSNGYNQTLGGDGGDASSGRKRSAKHIAAIKRAQTGKIVSAETRQRLSQARRGRKQTPEQIAAVSAGLKSSKKALNSSLKNLILARAAAVKTNKGKPHSTEHRAAISEGVKRTRAARFWSSGHGPRPRKKAVA